MRIMVIVPAATPALHFLMENVFNKSQNQSMPTAISLMPITTASDAHQGIISTLDYVPKLMIHAKSLTSKIEFANNAIQAMH